MNDVINLMLSHRSIRKFTDQQIPQANLETLIKAGQSAATSSFIQSCTIIQVNNCDKRAHLAELAGGQNYVAQAAIFLVFCADMQRHQLACDMHQQPMQSGFTEQFITATLDCGLFAQNVVLAAESLGLGSVYIGGLRNNIAQVGELLQLPDLVYPVFGLCLGYPAQNPEVKPRLPVEVVLKQDCYTDENDQTSINAYDQQLKQYYAARSSNVKQQGWSEQISKMLNKEARPHMLSYLQSKGYLQK
ncbi:MAG: oxygen-insensitive NADPH nitroreductase [Pseudomonadales bacterium]|nr:oxygen-insensitive NADPH nitroreductase [Pseudomonadales bacterium]NRA18025.1 oxygen-insensitive NADPH nitroreductase [Oceanospirillaceae bacterium]